MSKRIAACWRQLCSAHAALDFADALLHSYGNILFCDNAAIGLLFFVIFLCNGFSGIIGFAGAIIATAAARLLHADASLVKSGLFGLNGALIGFAWVLYVPPTLPALIMMGLLAALSTVLALLLLRVLTFRFKLSIMSWPFLFTTWIGIAALSKLPEGSVVWYNLPQIFNLIGDAGRWLDGRLPGFISLFFRIVSLIFFQNNVLIGVVCFMGLLLFSRISAFFAIVGAFVGTYIFFNFGSSSGPVPGELIVGFNCVLTAIAFGGFFIRLTWQSTLYAVFVTAVAAILSLTSTRLFDAIGLPLLATPFNVVTLVFLGLLSSGMIDPRRSGLVMVPLSEVHNPESSMESHHKESTIRWKSQKTELTLPFFATWYVCQGNHGSPTHSGHYTYAWDFIVLDQRNKSHRDFGSHNDDYYAFSLPVVAPADGKIVYVENHIPDNVPPEVNEENNWGNYVIIDHGNGEFSELSHFKQNSISVFPGQQVVRGQLLGFCGNSGRSAEAHLHYQLQDGEQLGAKALPAKFSNYLKHEGSNTILVKKGVPQMGESVSPNQESLSENSKR